MEIFKITHTGVNCSAVLHQNNGFSLNYPSIAVAFKNGTKSAVLQRTVTNVGTPNSTYTVQVVAPPGVKVSVAPTTLAFVEFGEKRSFQVTVSAPSPPAAKDSAEGSLVWKQSGGQGNHVVRSPIAVTWVVVGSSIASATSYSVIV
uniref:Subtilisin-like protease fibronectin type-III domain-containing protein n=1 Tax=Arundo donax TaxID=35708 RepID=A0A0A9H9P7_ARUDO